MHNIMKKILILFSLIFLALTMTFSVSAKTNYTENETTKIIDGVVYKLSADELKKNEYDVEKLYKFTQEIIFLETNSKISIEISEFDGWKNLKSVTFPEKCGNLTIGESAFKNCKALETVTFPKESGNITIGKTAFYFCEKLQDLTFPEKCGTLTIGNQAFRYCPNIKTLTLPKKSGDISIGKYAFYNCSGITKIKNTGNIVKIDDRAFQGCKSLTSVTISDKTKFIGEYAFYDCRALKKVYVNSKKDAPKLERTIFAWTHKKFEIIAKNETAAKSWKKALTKVGSKTIKVCYIEAV